MPSAAEGGRTASFSAITISAGQSTSSLIPAERSQLRVKLRYQLMPPVKPVAWKVSTKAAISSSLSSIGRGSHSGDHSFSISISAKLEAGAASPSFGAAMERPPLAGGVSAVGRRMKKLMVLPTSAASAASASPGVWKATMYIWSPNRRRMMAMGSAGGRGMKGVLTPITPAVRSG